MAEEKLQTVNVGTDAYIRPRTHRQLQPQSGERMQPTAQAVGKSRRGTSPEGAKDDHGCHPPTSPADSAAPWRTRAPAPINPAAPPPVHPPTDRPTRSLSDRWI